MSRELERLLELARHYRMSKEEQDEQVRSFAYGNTRLENEAITKEDISDAMVRLREKSDRPGRS